MSQEKLNRNVAGVPEALLVYGGGSNIEIPLNDKAEKVLRDLTEKEREELGGVIKRIGGLNIPTFREALVAAIGLAGIAPAAPSVFAKYSALSTTEDLSSTAIETETNSKAQLPESVPKSVVIRPESRPAYIEVMNVPSVHVDGYTATIQGMVHLHPDQVLFTNENGELLTTEPVTITAAAGYTPAEMTMSYEEGGPVGIPGLWSTPQKNLLLKHLD